MGFTRQQLWILVGVCLCNGTLFAGVALVAPFLPLTAEGMGLDYISIGILVAIEPTVRVIFLLFWSRFGRDAGIKRMLVVGTIGVTLAQGFLGLAPTAIWMGVCRAVHGVCEGVFTTATLGSLTEYMGKKVTLATGWLMASGGLGMVVSPAVGGVLYELGGLLLPFGIFSGLLLASLVVIVVVMPKDKNRFSRPRAEESTQQTGSTASSGRTIPWKAFLDREVILACWCSILSSMGIMYLSSNLSLWLTHEYNLSPTANGLYFGLVALCYALVAPSWSLIAERVPLKAILGGGHIAMGIGAILYAPWRTLIPAKMPFWWPIPFLALIGISISSVSTTSFPDFLASIREALKRNATPNRAPQRKAHGLRRTESLRAIRKYLYPASYIQRETERHEAVRSFDREYSSSTVSSAAADSFRMSDGVDLPASIENLAVGAIQKSEKGSASHLDLSSTAISSTFTLFRAMGEAIGPLVSAALAQVLGGIDGAHASFGMLLFGVFVFAFIPVLWLRARNHVPDSTPTSGSERISV